MLDWRTEVCECPKRKGNPHKAKWDARAAITSAFFNIGSVGCLLLSQGEDAVIMFPTIHGLNQICCCRLFAGGVSFGLFDTIFILWRGVGILAFHHSNCSLTVSILLYLQIGSYCVFNGIGGCGDTYSRPTMWSSDCLDFFSSTACTTASTKYNIRYKC